MLTDIWGTPDVLRNLLHFARQVSTRCGAFLVLVFACQKITSNEVIRFPTERQVYMKNGSVEIPGLREKLPAGHGLAGKTPLEIMSACSQKRMPSGFMNRQGSPPMMYHFGGGFRRVCQPMLIYSYTWCCFSSQTFLYADITCVVVLVCGRFSVIGSGTSWHATLLAEYLIEYMARIPVEAHYASEYRYHEPALRLGDVVIVVSMSGETVDAVESIRQITRHPEMGKSVLKVAVVNNSSSSLASECDLVINVRAGAEVSQPKLDMPPTELINFLPPALPPLLLQLFIFTMFLNIPRTTLTSYHVAVRDDPLTSLRWVLHPQRASPPRASFSSC